MQGNPSTLEVLIEWIPDSINAPFQARVSKDLACNLEGYIEQLEQMYPHLQITKVCTLIPNEQYEHDTDNFYGNRATTREISLHILALQSSLDKLLEYDMNSDAWAYHYTESQRQTKRIKQLNSLNNRMHLLIDCVKYNVTQ